MFFGLGDDDIRTASPMAISHASQSAPQKLAEKRKMANWRDIIFKSVFQGGLYAAGSAILFGELGTSFQIFNTNIPAIVPLGFIGGLGSLSSDLLHDYVFNLIPRNEKLANAESALTGLALNVGLTQAFLYGIMGAPTEGLFNNVLYSAGNYALSEYLWHNIVSQKEKGFIL